MIYYLLFSICESISNQRLPKIYNLRLIYKNLDILTSEGFLHCFEVILVKIKERFTKKNPLWHHFKLGQKLELFDISIVNICDWMFAWINLTPDTIEVDCIKFSSTCMIIMQLCPWTKLEWTSHQINWALIGQHSIKSTRVER